MIPASIRPLLLASLFISPLAVADTEAITTAELGALAKEYLGRTRVSRATVLPGAVAAPVIKKD